MSADKSTEVLEMDEEPETEKCSKSTKILLFLLNFIIWAGSCTLLALGIYALVDSPSVRSLMGDSLLTMAAIVVIIVGGIGFLISFLGCCGAFSNSKCLVMTYIVIIICLLAVILIGGILGFMFSDTAENAAVDYMKKALKKYNPSRKNSKLVESWDDMQSSMQCCGVLLYKDWENLNDKYPLRNGDVIPESCCKITDQIPKPTPTCLNGSNKNRIYADGCYDKAIKLVKKHSPVIGIVGAVVAFCMVLGILLGIVVYKRL